MENRDTRVWLTMSRLATLPNEVLGVLHIHNLRISFKHRRTCTTVSFSAKCSQAAIVEHGVCKYPLRVGAGPKLPTLAE
ncbi:hypothetical protein XELAEV_18026948mg [Xenopus laevis]|uniref:Uncharacterized protein n=1 Tax=Xenopus laevis TaxID=8355 RepID=A0A974CUM5_XENLA|nr:hypothetical protein XELAEV_18026948mg [Xenopus laevis]